MIWQHTVRHRASLEVSPLTSVRAHVSKIELDKRAGLEYEIVKAAVIAEYHHMYLSIMTYLPAPLSLVIAFPN